MENVWLNDVEYEAVSSNQLSMQTNIPDYPVEDAALSDHLILVPPEFDITLKCYTIWDADVKKEVRSDQYLRLRDLWISRTPFTLKCNLGVFDDMTIKSLLVGEGVDSKNTFEVDIRLKQIVTATLQPIVLKVITDADGSDIHVSSEDLEYTEVGLTEPTSVKEEDKSILENLWGWLTTGEYDG